MHNQITPCPECGGGYMQPQEGSPDVLISHAEECSRKLTPQQYLPPTWVNRVAEAIVHSLPQHVIDAMLGYGEDPTNTALYKLRRDQVVISIRSAFEHQDQHERPLVENTFTPGQTVEFLLDGEWTRGRFHHYTVPQGSAVVADVTKRRRIVKVADIRPATFRSSGGHHA